MKLALRIALRFLTSNKGQTIMIALGIAIGISVQIFIGSLIQGLQIGLVDATIGRASHITVQAAKRNEPVTDYSKVASFVNDNFDQVTAVSPTITLNGFIMFDDNFDRVLFRGFDIEKADKIYKFSDAILEGGRMPGKDEILIGVTLANNNGIRVGDVVTMMSPERNSYEARVSGLFDLKVAAVNESWAVGDLTMARSVFGLDENSVTAIEMQIAAPFEADVLSSEIIAGLADADLAVSDWKEANAQLLSGLSGQTTSSLIIQVFVVISVVLGIASVLAITVLQKSKQIGILKAMGISDSTSSLIFLFQGFLLGIVGGLLGIIFGLGLLWSFSTFALNPDGTPVVAIFINPGFIVLSGIIAVAASTAASIVPAINSKKLSPIEVIRNG